MHASNLFLPPACLAERGYPSSRKRLFLSAKGWQPGGVVPEGASLLGFSHGDRSAGAGLPADELPACLLCGGALRLQAFTAKRAQARIMGRGSRGTTC